PPPREVREEPGGRVARRTRKRRPCRCGECVSRASPAPGLLPARARHRLQSAPPALDRLGYLTEGPAALRQLVAHAHGRSRIDSPRYQAARLQLLEAARKNLVSRTTRPL